jgi:hypothetical protein
MNHLTRIPLLIFFVTLGQFAHGQAALLVLIFGDKAASENFHFSIDAGVNLSTMPGVSGSSMAAGAYFGLGTYIKLNDKWAFTPEFKPLSPRGANGFAKLFEDNTGAVGSSATRLKLSYIDVPLQFRRRISERFYVRAGPQISFLTGGELATTGELVGGSDFTVTENIKDQLEPIDISVPIDLGIVFAKPRGYKGLDIRVRYCHGFTEVFKENATGLSSTNSTFQFFLSLPFVNVEPKPGS